MMGKNWFKSPGDLGQSISNISGSSYFKTAGNLDYKNSSVATIDNLNFKDYKKKMQEWLDTISSGKSAYNGDFGNVIPSGKGQKFVSLEELKVMITNGDNIISAKYYENMNMILVEFETFNLNSSHIRH